MPQPKILRLGFKTELNQDLNDQSVSRLSLKTANLELIKAPSKFLALTSRYFGQQSLRQTALEKMLGHVEALKNLEVLLMKSSVEMGSILEFA